MPREVKYNPALSWEENCRRADAAKFKPAAPYIRGDLPAYVSPVTGKPVDGRAARREDLARTGCREVDPSEHKAVYRNYEFCQKHRKPYMSGDVPPPMTKDEKMQARERRAAVKKAEKAADDVRVQAAEMHTDPDLAKFVRGNVKSKKLFDVNGKQARH